MLIWPDERGLIDNLAQGLSVRFMSVVRDSSTSAVEAKQRIDNPVLEGFQGWNIGDPSSLNPSKAPNNNSTYSNNSQTEKSNKKNLPDPVAPCWDTGDSFEGGSHQAISPILNPSTAGVWTTRLARISGGIQHVMYKVVRRLINQIMIYLNSISFNWMILCMHIPLHNTQGSPGMFCPSIAPPKLQRHSS